MTDATDLKGHRTATSLRFKRRRSWLIGRTKGGMITRLHAVAVADADGRPIRLFLSAGRVGGYTDAAAVLRSLPDADGLLADRNHGADWFRQTLQSTGIMSGIPSRTSRSKPIRYDKRRKRTEVMFGRFEDGRRVATRYDRLSKMVLFAVVLAATVMFWP